MKPVGNITPFASMAATHSAAVVTVGHLARTQLMAKTGACRSCREHSISTNS